MEQSDAAGILCAKPYTYADFLHVVTNLKELTAAAAQDGVGGQLSGTFESLLETVNSGNTTDVFRGITKFKTSVETSTVPPHSPAPMALAQQLLAIIVVQLNQKKANETEFYAVIFRYFKVFGDIIDAYKETSDVSEQRRPFLEKIVFALRYEPMHSHGTVGNSLEWKAIDRITAILHSMQ